MTNDEKLRLVSQAIGRPVDAAMELLEALEAFGLSIYKKKVIHAPRRPVTSTPMTEALKKEIAEYYAKHPDLTQADVAAYFRVNSGRVAEVVAQSSTAGWLEPKPQ